MALVHIVLGEATNSAFHYLQHWTPYLYSPCAGSSMDYLKDQAGQLVEYW